MKDKSAVAMCGNGANLLAIMMIRRRPLMQKLSTDILKLRLTLKPQVQDKCVTQTLTFNKPL